MRIDMPSSEESLLIRMRALQQFAAGETDIQSSSSAHDDTFSSVMQQTVRRINTEQNVASQMMSAVDAGQSDDLVGAMVASQKAGLSFAALMQVRNKLMTGLDDIMRLTL